MTDYQRGNRDGLLGLAAQLKQQLDTLHAEFEATKAKETARNRWQVGVICQGIAGRITAYDHAIALAERLAEALPEEK